MRELSAGWGPVFPLIIREAAAGLQRYYLSPDTPHSPTYYSFQSKICCPLLQWIISTCPLLPIGIPSKSVLGHDGKKYCSCGIGRVWLSQPNFSSWYDSQLSHWGGIRGGRGGFYIRNFRSSAKDVEITTGDTMLHLSVCKGRGVFPLLCPES